MAELPAIMKWALRGLDRLRQRGKFTEGAVATEARADTEESETPPSTYGTGAQADAPCDRVRLPMAMGGHPQASILGSTGAQQR